MRGKPYQKVLQKADFADDKIHPKVGKCLVVECQDGVRGMVWATNPKQQWLLYCHFVPGQPKSGWENVNIRVVTKEEVKILGRVTIPGY